MNMEDRLKRKQTIEELQNNLIYLDSDVKGLKYIADNYLFAKKPIEPEEIRKDFIIGYTSGVFDLFHTGHLNLLKNARGMCDRLIVGVTTDDLSLYKGKKPLIPFEDRIEIIRSIKYVDAVVPQETMDKAGMCEKLKASVLFVGDDWYATPKWEQIEQELSELGVRVVYFPYTKGVSSTSVSEALLKSRGWRLGE